jgi:predicted transcriptional regulator
LTSEDEGVPECVICKSCPAVPLRRNVKRDVIVVCLEMTRAYQISVNMLRSHRADSE